MWGWGPAWPGKGWGPKGGWGWGKGWGKGYGPRKPRNPLPDDFNVAPTSRFLGEVSVFYKFQGYGFVTLDEKNLVPGDKVFVYWKNIRTNDRFPSLVKGMRVQFSLAIEEKNGVKTASATNVTMENGASVSVQDESDEKKTFVGGKMMRYQGVLKFFIPKRGYGYITVKEGYTYDVEGVPTEIRCELAEMNAGGAQPSYLKDVPVEFGIWQTPKGAFKAHNVTQPGGVPLAVSESV
mmetsp:Transcript_16984/g.30703  ORF Transcript_16984/g.30703 Transcript_16984/m.30703 type:complete len:236 (-) Transcript_16984:134-841(-)